VLKDFSEKNSFSRIVELFVEISTSGRDANPALFGGAMKVDAFSG
jgi:hypothetical protein